MNKTPPIKKSSRGAQRTAPILRLSARSRRVIDDVLAGGSLQVPTPERQV